MTFLPGVLGEAVVCPPNTNSEPSWDEKDGERGWKDESMQGRKNARGQQHTRQR